MKTNVFFKSAFVVSSLMMMVGCSQENVTEQVENNLCTMMVNVTESGFSTMNDDSRVVTSDDYKTSFEDNDQIGLFIVENETGKLLKNMALTKSGSNWEGTVYYYDNADYIAYYPYDAQLKEVASVADIEKYFSDNKYTDDQSTEENYRNCDLMTAVVEAENLTETSPLNLNFTHNNALVEFNIPYYSYSTEADGAGYRYSVPVDLTLELGESDTFKPYQVAVGKYRVIVPVGESLAFNGQFTDAKLDKPVYVNAEIKNGLAKNAGMVYNVTYTDSPTVGTIATRPLEPGDYYCADGNIVPNDFTGVPENCIGVVFATTTNNEKALDGTTTCSNGYVMALVGATAKNSPITNAWDYFWGINNLSIDGLNTVAVNSFNDAGLVAAIQNNEYSGLDNTTLLIKNDPYTNSADNAYINDAVLTFGDAEQYTSIYAAPLKTTGWFIPTAYQFTQIIKNLGADENGNFTKSDNSTITQGEYDGTQKILTDAPFTKINGLIEDLGGAIATNKSFWTSTIVSNTTTTAPVYFNISSAKGNFVAKEIADNETSSNYNKRNVRLILAF